MLWFDVRCSPLRPLSQRVAVASQSGGLDWRARCRARLAARRTNRAKPAPRPGQLVVFAAAICFRNGRSFTQLRAVRLPGRRGLIFQAEDGGFYRIPGFKALDYAIAPAPPPVAA